MKILGSAERKVGESYYNKETFFIVEISFGEIRRVSNKSGYRSEDDDKKLMAQLQPGMDFPIDEGHDFRKDIVEAVDAMRKAHEKCAPVATAMAAFANLIHTKDTEA